MDIVRPSDAEELQNLMFTAQQGIKHPLAIRYPRGYTSKTKEVYDFKTIPWGKGRLLKKGTTIAILSLGTLATIIEDAIKNGKIKITKLAQGLPVGGEIEQLDDGTLYSAFKNRVPVTE